MQAAVSYRAGLSGPTRQQTSRMGSKPAVCRPLVAPSTLKRGELQAARVLGGGPKKTLKREEEPEEYWSSERERQGKSPWSDPIALMGILAILGPIILLGLFAALGLVKLPN